MKRKQGRRAWHLIAAIAITIGIDCSASAQSEDNNLGPEPPADILIVTGTRIPRPDATAASPVAAFDRDQLDAFREINVEEFLNELPQVVPGRSRSTIFGGDGTATVNLRGLGPTRTLTLLNGRRFAPSGASDGTSVVANANINVIPAALLERVEIVTGGASAVYGSDAVAGAVNFITRTDFDGIELNSQFDIYGAGDGETFNINVAAGTGFADGRGHVSIYGDYLNRASLFGDARAFTSQIFREDFNTGELVESGTFILPEGIFFFPQVNVGGMPGFATFNTDGSLRFAAQEDAFNAAPEISTQVGMERWSGGLMGEFEASEGLSFYTELMYSRNRTDLQFSSSNPQTAIAFAVDADFFADSTREFLRAAFDPDGNGIGQGFFAKTLTEIGPRSVPVTFDHYRGLGGVTLDLNPNWSLDGYYSFDLSDTDILLDNAISRTRFTQGILTNPLTGECFDASDGCVPVNVFGEGNLTPEATDFIRVDGLRNGFRTTQHVASIAATGAVAEVPSGTIQLSLGGEFRRNFLRYNPDPRFETGDIIGYGVAGSAISGAINVYEVFGEAVIPLLKDRPFAQLLELEIGGRFSHYSTTGGVWTWKAGGQWLLVDGLRLRGMWQRAVRAPNVQELLAANASLERTFFAGDDFCLGVNNPVERGLGDICIAQGMDPAALSLYGAAGSGLENLLLPVTLTERGNADLEPERANSITVGAEYVFDAPFNLDVGADYFSVVLDNAINQVSNPFGLCEIVADAASDICGLVRRAPTGLPVELVSTPLNIAVTRVRGIDARFALSADAPRWVSPATGATVFLRALGTRYLEYGNAASAFSPFVDCAGGFDIRCSSSIGTTYPRTLITTTTGYDTRLFGVSLQWRWISGVENLEPTFDALSGAVRPPQAIPFVDDRNYLDVSFRVRIADRAKLRFGVENLLATEPPLLGDAAAGTNTDPGRYDIYGRRIFMALNVGFGG